MKHVDTEHKEHGLEENEIMPIRQNGPKKHPRMWLKRTRRLLASAILSVLLATLVLTTGALAQSGSIGQTAASSHISADSLADSEAHTDEEAYKRRSRVCNFQQWLNR